VFSKLGDLGPVVFDELGVRTCEFGDEFGDVVDFCVLHRC
jgi:hypothetical protein